MADGKKSFVLYCDLIHVVKKLPKDKAGELLVTILEYVNDLNPVVQDLTVELVFEPIKQQLKRDLKKWESGQSDRIQKARVAGIASGEARRTKSNSVDENELSSSNRTKRTANVNGNVSVTGIKSTKEIDTVVVKEQEINNNFYQFFRRAAGSHLSEQELRHEVGKFRNKYPNIQPNTAGALINTWVNNIGNEKPKDKKMVL